MDKLTAKAYKKMGYTHWAVIPRKRQDDPDGYTPVTEDKDRGFFVDANGQDYTHAFSLDNPEPGENDKPVKAGSSTQ